MKIQCDFCGNTYEDFLENCPSCGAPNPSHHDGDKQPHTIEELKKWYEDRHLPPPETTRFFIGVDYKDPRAFGIYKDDSGEFVVYKNKADGSRAIRYKGKDEAYAVDEIYQKLKDEIVHQKARNSSRKTQTRVDPKLKKIYSAGSTIAVIAFVAIFSVNTFIGSTYNRRHNGYYNFGDVVYYNDSGDWYYFDDHNEDWYDADVPVQYDENNTDPYFMGRTYEDVDWESTDEDLTKNADGSTKSIPDIEDSTAYQDNHSSDSDSDYDWDSGSDSWDSGGSDWDSDW